MRLVMLGPPGSGKGTQGALLSVLYGIPAVSTGNLLREATDEPSGLAREIKTTLERGHLVSDGIVNELVRKRFEKDDTAKGWVLDGYPRNISQAEALDELLKKSGNTIDRVLLVAVGDHGIVDRLGARRVCPACHSVYNLVTNPPNRTDQCDKCDGGLIRRDDDNPETIRARLVIYHGMTGPLILYYLNMGILGRINGDQEPKLVTQEISRLIEH